MAGHKCVTNRNAALESPCGLVVNTLWVLTQDPCDDPCGRVWFCAPSHRKMTGLEGPAEGDTAGQVRKLMALWLPWCPPPPPSSPLPPSITLVWFVPQAASHDLTDSGRHRHGQSPPACPTNGQCPGFSGGRGTQDSVLQPLKNSHADTLEAGSLLDSCQIPPHEPTGVSGATAGFPSPQQQCTGKDRLRLSPRVHALVSLPAGWDSTLPASDVS